MEVDNLKIIGVPQLSGRLSFVISTKDRTSLTASSMLLPHSSSSVTMDILSLLCDVICFKPSTEVSAFSIIFVTFVSISLAEAPGYVVITVIYGGSISGNWSIGKFRKLKIPITITATKIRAVVTGFSIAVLYIAILF